MSDGWEPGPDPVREFVTLRTVQVSLPLLAGLVALSRVLPAKQFWPLVPATGVAVTAGLSAYFNAVFHHRTSWGYPLTTRLPLDAGNAIALTFDDGPHPDTTPELLDILAEYDAKATFFFVAERAKAYPELARRTVEAGHTIGCHGLRHRSMVGQGTATVRNELEEAERMLEDAARRKLSRRLLRPPHGFKTPALCRTAIAEGWTLVSWSVDPRDYDPVSPRALTESLNAQLTAGDIVLLHERPAIRTANEALPGILRLCRNRGFRAIALG